MCSRSSSRLCEHVCLHSRHFADHRLFAHIHIPSELGRMLSSNEEYYRNENRRVEYVTSWATQLTVVDGSTLESRPERMCQSEPPRTSNPGMPDSGVEFTEVSFDTYEPGAFIVCVKPGDPEDETVGVTTANKIVLTQQDGSQVTAREVILDLHNRAPQMGYKSVDVNLEDDERIVVRFKTILVPLRPEETQRRVVPTYSDSPSLRRKGVQYHPRNIVLLGTPNAIYVHSKANGTNRFYLNSKKEEGVKNWWLVTEEPRDLLHARSPSSDEGLAAEKSQSPQVGLKGMCSSGNCFVLISIPNTEKPNPNANKDIAEQWYPTAEFGCKNIQPLQCSYMIDQNDTWEDTAEVKESQAKMASEEAKNPPCIVRAQGEPIVVTIVMYKTIKTSDALHISSDDIAHAKHEMSRMFSFCDTSCKCSELRAILFN